MAASLGFEPTEACLNIRHLRCLTAVGVFKRIATFERPYHLRDWRCFIPTEIGKT